MSLAPQLDLQPVLTGPNLLLRPMQQDDFEALYKVASDKLMWEQHPDPLRWQRPVFEVLFNSTASIAITLQHPRINRHLVSL